MKIKTLLIALALLTSFIFAQTTRPATQLEDADFKFMLRGYCYAGSKIPDKQALGGFAGSSHFPKPIKPGKGLRSGEYYLLANPGESSDFYGKYKGMTLHLINATNKPVAFPAQDSRLPIIQEAKDKSGQWRPIEYLASSWCGNSYHRIFLGSNQYWSFDVPRYAGKFKTKLRFKLEGEKIIYSNEFEGSINEEQFSIKQGYTPNGIMDPYIN